MSPRLFLQSQIVETDRLLGMVGNHPWMAPNLRSRKAEFEAKLRDLPPDAPETKATLYFTGAPVFGSVGIDAEFAANVLSPFSRMVKSQHSAAWRSAVALRRTRRKDLDAKLLLTALPRGSFGLELSPATQDKPDNLRIVADALTNISELIEAAGDTDAAFAEKSAESPSRTLAALRDFLWVMKEQRADVRLVTGQREITLSRDEMEAAFERVRSTVSSEHTDTVAGVSRGIALDSGRFDFRPEEGDDVISGSIADEVEPGQAERMALLAYQVCVATIRTTEVQYRDGRTRTTYELLDLRQPENL
jgi:hypothetical protein